MSKPPRGKPAAPAESRADQKRFRLPETAARAIADASVAAGFPVPPHAAREIPGYVPQVPIQAAATTPSEPAPEAPAETPEA